MKSAKLQEVQDKINADKKQKGSHNTPAYDKILTSKLWRTDNDTPITNTITAGNRFEYMKGPVWASRRTAWWRTHFENNRAAKCIVCKSSTERLQLHHITYKRYYGKELDKDLVPICSDCHVMLHGFAKASGFLHGKGGSKSLYTLSRTFFKHARKRKSQYRSRICAVARHPMIQQKLKNKNWITLPPKTTKQVKQTQKIK